MGKSHDPETDFSVPTGNRLYLGERILPDIYHIVEKSHPQVDDGLQSFPVNPAISYETG